MERISDKLHSIVVLLNKDEVKKISTILKSQKNKKIEKLFRIMLDSLETEISKEIAFKKIFEQEYKKDLDFLLRNECRLLYNLIKNAIIEFQIKAEEAQDDFFKDMLFLKAIQDRNDKTLFTKEILQLIDKATTQFEYSKAIRMCDMYFNASGIQQNQNLPMILKTHEILLKEQEYINLYYITRSLINNTRISSLSLLLNEKERQQYNIYANNEIAIPKEPDNNDLICYNKLINKYITTTEFEARVTILEQAKELIEKIVLVNKAYQKDLDYCTINIASMYYIAQKYTEAKTMFESYYKTNPPISNYLLTSIINYGNCLLQLGNYAEILDFTVQYNTYFINNGRLAMYYNALLCNVYLMTENTDRLRKQIPQHFQEFPEPFVLHYRFCLCILYFLENNIELALREARNLADTIAYKKSYEEHLVIAKLFHKFMDKYDKREAIDHKKYKAQMLQDLDNFEKDCTYNFKIFIPSKWLRRRLQKL